MALASGDFFEAVRLRELGLGGLTALVRDDTSPALFGRDDWTEKEQGAKRGRPPSASAAPEREQFGGLFQGAIQLPAQLLKRSAALAPELAV